MYTVPTGVKIGIHWFIKDIRERQASFPTIYMKWMSGATKKNRSQFSRCLGRDKKQAPPEDEWQTPQLENAKNI